tara:strand:- start:5453 stop:6358 length:906 start_codon:yes stop_codon:yes gene_type:complete
MTQHKILLLGSSGQLGLSIKELLEKKYTLREINRPELVFEDSEDLKQRVLAFNPKIIINSSAYTSVDLAENERIEAEIANSLGPSLLAEISKELGSLLIHYSTDYVFDGQKNTAYKETDECNPINFYGKSKRDGEKAILESNCKSLIIRTSWVYSHLRNNFLLTILKLATSKNEIKVIDDQYGSPTSTEQIALATFNLLENYLRGNLNDLGLYHFSSIGKTSWYGFAKEIVDQAEKLDFNLTLRKENIEPIKSEEYGAIAERPKNSFLDITKILSVIDINVSKWQVELVQVLKKIKKLTYE